MSERGRLGGIASHGTTMAQHRLDVEECQAYLAAHPGATALTVAVTGEIDPSREGPGDTNPCLTSEEFAKKHQEKW